MRVVIAETMPFAAEGYKFAMLPAASLAAPVRDVRRFNAAPHVRESATRPVGFRCPSTSDVKRAVLAALSRSGYAALAFLSCEVDRQRVILRGSVPSYHLKQLAQVHAQRVEGVERIDNRLEVRRRSGV